MGHGHTHTNTNARDHLRRPGEKIVTARLTQNLLDIAGQLYSKTHSSCDCLQNT